MIRLIPLLFLIHTQVFAECSSKNLTAPDYLRSVGKENLIEHFSKPRDQDSVGWCGAYGPSDSLTFAAGEAVSATDISIDFYGRIKTTALLKDLSGVTLSATAELAEDIGYCPEAVIPSSQTSSSNLGGAALLNMMQAFQEITHDFNEKGMPSNYCVSCAGDQYAKKIKPALPHVTEKMIREVLIANHGLALRSVRALMNKLCEGKRKILKFESPSITKTQGKPATPLIDEALNNGAIPSIDINTSFFAKEDIVVGGHSNHALAVVGRRTGADGKCEYLMRNSWGTGCSYYLPHIAKKCDPAKGSFWMSEDILNGNVNNVVHLKIKNKDNSTIAKEPTPAPVPPAPIDNRSTKKPFGGMDFGGLISKVIDGIETAVSGIWQALSNIFKY